MRIGIDLGISSTKVVCVDNQEILRTELWERGLDMNRLSRLSASYGSRLEGYSVTGVGSKNLVTELLGRPVTIVDEFDANAKAARWACEEDRFVVISMGTGTGFVLLDSTGHRHLGGSALGGGSLKGLSSLLLPQYTFEEFLSLAESGTLSNIDLVVGDVCNEALPGLPLDTTATNFGKADKDSSPQDIAAGLVNLILQNIGVMANFAGKGQGISCFLLIGRMATLPKCREIFDRLEALYGIRFIIPEQSPFMTAIGAAFS